MENTKKSKHEIGRYVYKPIVIDKSRLVRILLVNK